MQHFEHDDLQLERGDKEMFWKFCSNDIFISIASTLRTFTRMNNENHKKQVSSNFRF